MTVKLDVPPVPKSLVEGAQRDDGLVLFCIVCWHWVDAAGHHCLFDDDEPEDERYIEYEQPLYGCDNCDRTIPYKGLCGTCQNEGIGHCFNWERCKGLVDLDDGMYCGRCRLDMAEGRTTT